MKKKLKKCFVWFKKCWNATANILKTISLLINVIKWAKRIIEYWPIIHAMFNQLINN